MSQDEPLLPATAEAFLPMPAPKTMTTPPRGLVFSDLASGEAPLIYQPEGTYEKPAITEALQSMLTVGPVMGITNPNTWEDLLAAAGAGTADVFVVDRRGERYKVIDVLFDFGGETGELRLRHLGRRSRQGDLYVDLERAFGYMIPIVVYKSRQSFRKNPDERMRRLARRGDDPIAARIERIRRGVEPRPPLSHFISSEEYGGAQILYEQFEELGIPTFESLAEDVVVLQELGDLPRPGDVITLHWSLPQARRQLRLDTWDGEATDEWQEDDTAEVVVDRVFFEFPYHGDAHESIYPSVFLIPHVVVRFPTGSTGELLLWPPYSGGYGADPDFVPGWISSRPALQVRIEEFDPYGVNRIPLVHRSFMQRHFGLDEDPFEGAYDPVEGP